MKYFCETKLSYKAHFFISETKPNNNKIKAFPLEASEKELEELEKNITLYNTMLAPHNVLYLYMLLAETCVDKDARDYFNKKASDLASVQLKLSY